MDRVTTLLYERQSPKTKELETKARDGKFAPEVVAEKAAKLAGRRLSKEQREKTAGAIHWSVGVSSGALYGVLRNRIHRLGIGSGVAYGIALSLLLDEAALTALGLSPPPAEFPWQTHARGVAGHIVLGAVLDAAFLIYLPHTAARRASRPQLNR
jgi:uncharacterized membrane protein YagU involved in acid resistance